MASNSAARTVLESGAPRPRSRDGEDAKALSADSRFTWIAALVLAIACAVLFLTASREGDFWWSDAPRHALNGVFIRDLIADLPLGDPRQYAIDYYLKYPALTILLYPPLLYAVMAPFFLVFGVSHATAQAVIALFTFAFAMASYALARRWLSPVLALALAVIMIAIPESAFWSRQVMLELPGFAFLIGGLWFLVRHLDRGRPLDLHAALFLVLCGAYTRLTLVFIVPAIAIALLAHYRLDAWRHKHLWIGAAWFAAAIVPLIAMTVLFGQANVKSVTGVENAPVAGWTVKAMVWYLARLPEQMNWPIVALAALGAGGFALHRPWRASLPHAPLLIAWFVVGYAFFTAIDLKDTRFTLFILWPVALMALLALDRVLARGKAELAACAVALLTFAATLAWYPAPKVAGYREAAEAVADLAPRDSVVMFSGNRDGSFIFNLRARADRRDLSVLRSDKLLLSVAINRDYGVGQKGYDEAEIAALISQSGAAYVVAERDFWTDLQVMARLQAVLDSPQFEEVRRIPVVANRRVPDREIRVYRNRAEVATGERRLRLDIPAIGRGVEGRIGQ